MEPVDQGTLKESSEWSQKNYSLHSTLSYCAATSKYFKIMHSKNILHRDIKPDSILLFSFSPYADVNVKLTDFGTTNVMSPSGLKDRKTS